MRYVVLCVLTLSSLWAQINAPRPHLLGIAHVAFRAGDLSKTSAFYKDFLGYEEPFSLRGEDGRTTIQFVKVNERQYVELFQGDSRSQGQLDHFALYTDNLQAMRSYLQVQGVPLVADIHQGQVGNSFLTVRDPDGHLIEILQYSSRSKTGKSQGKFLPASRVSNHISHVGILVNSVGSAMQFYRDILGFREFARGGGANGQLGWVDLQFPDGSDYVEFIPYSGLPSAADLKAQNHFCMLSPNIHNSIALLQTRAGSGFLPTSIKLQTGGNLPSRANLFDPDGARLEIMEPILGKVTAGVAP